MPKLHTTIFSSTRGQRKRAKKFLSFPTHHHRDKKNKSKGWTRYNKLLSYL
jgi:hypothetical protein